ncbi:MAG: c-type cytochrome biogenesis protein CcmI [Phenylobacterium sp.]|uniref:c-type cytochrome biogenesis protein CcmI n=1 Tax=Phenylobacterium sp. TaxID=1871053 RepID=UPI00391B1F84
MISFWVVAALLSAAAAGLVLQRAARAGASAPAEDPALSLYRRQLQEIDDLAERGLLGEAERKSAHAEAGRRLLGADARRAASWSAGGSRRAILAIATAGPLLAIGLYLSVGSPGAPDQPYAARLDQWVRTPPERLDPPRLAAVLKALVARRPNDPEAFRYLAMAEAASGDTAEASRALRRAIELAPERIDLWEALSEVLLVEAEGAVTPQAEAALRQALKRDPESVMARFHLARGRIEAGDRAGGLADWRALLADLKPDDPRRATLQAAIADAEKAPAPAPPPAFAGDQLEAIRGMVAGLAARLEESPDDAEGWVRLVRSYAVLGDDAARDAALAKARARYAERPDVLQALDAAAATPAMTPASESRP